MKRICEKCKKSFRPKGEYWKRKQKYCSKDCWKIRNPPIENICKKCGKIFLTYPSQKKPYCSQFCRDIDYETRLKGRSSHWWRGGKTKKSQIIRSSAKYARWRMSVFLRDNFTCQICGIKKTYLHADHIKPFSKYPELRFKLSNGRALCIPCHRKTDTYGPKANVTYEKRQRQKNV